MGGISLPFPTTATGSSQRLLALLLSAQSKVELSQAEFYQEIKIRTLRDAASSDHLKERTSVLPDAVD